MPGSKDEPPADRPLRGRSGSPYWLELLVAAGIVPTAKLEPLRKAADELTAIFRDDPKALERHLIALFLSLSYIHLNLLVGASQSRMSWAERQENKVRDREGAITSTRVARAPQSKITKQR